MTQWQYCDVEFRPVAAPNRTKFYSKSTVRNEKIYLLTLAIGPVYNEPARLIYIAVVNAAERLPVIISLKNKS